MTPEDKVRKTDETLYEIFREFRLFHYINPANHAEERETFLERWEYRKAYHPKYEYNLLPSTIPRWRKRMENIDLGDTPLEKTYRATADELMTLLDLAEARGTPEITSESLLVYTPPTPEVLEEAWVTLRKGAAREEGARDTGVKGVIERLRERLRGHRVDGWDVIEDPTCVSLAEVDSAHHKIRIQSGILVSDRAIDRLAHHLVDVHVFRTINGERQPLKAFAVGLHHHFATEEGLAVKMEELLGLLTPSLRRKYAARAIVAAMATEKSFFDIVSELVKFFDVEEAFTLAERSKRGLADTSQPGGFIQDHVFLQGKKKVDPLSNDDLRMLFVGKISVEQLPLIQELIDQHQLVDAAFLPEPLHG